MKNMNYSKLQELKWKQRQVKRQNQRQKKLSYIVLVLQNWVERK